MYIHCDFSIIKLLKLLPLAVTFFPRGKFDAIPVIYTER